MKTTNLILTFILKELGNKAKKRKRKTIRGINAVENLC